MSIHSVKIESLYCRLSSMSTGHCPGSNMAFWRKSRFFQPSENSYFQPRPFSKMHHHPTYRLGQLFPSHRISHETLIKIWKYQPFLTIGFSRNVWRTSFSRSLWPGLLLCSILLPCSSNRSFIASGQGGTKKRPRMERKSRSIIQGPICAMA